MKKLIKFWGFMVLMAAFVVFSACDSGSSSDDSPEGVPVTGVSLVETMGVVVGSTVTLAATITPANATNQNVTWSSSNTDVATVSGGIVTGVTEGTAVITVKTEDGGYTDTCSVSVTATNVAVTGVSLDEESIEIGTGETATLAATVEPANATNQNVTWSSSDTDVATVLNGTVTGVAAGTATITVTTVDGGYTDTCDVKVENVAVSGVSLDKATISIVAGSTGTLIATVEPSNAANRNVIWISSNTGVATVTNGTVTGVSEGSATITVITIDGGYRDTCEVTVTAPATPVAVTGVSLDEESIEIGKGSTSTLTATVEPSNATNKNVIWESDNTNVATVSNGTVTGVSEGTAIITVITTDGGYTDTCQVTVTAPVAVTGVSLDEESIEIGKGETATLTATVEPSNATNKNVIWESDDTDVATVSNGTVTGVAAGTAVITVTTEDGGYTDTCSVTVTFSVIGSTGTVVGIADMDGDDVKDGYALDADNDGNPDGVDTDNDGKIDVAWSSVFVTNFGTPDGYASSGYGPGVTDQNYSVQGATTLSQLKQLIPDWQDTASGSWNIEAVIVSVQGGTLNNGIVDESTIEKNYCWVQDSSGAMYLDNIDLKSYGITLGLNSIGKTLSLTVTDIRKHKPNVGRVYCITAVSAAMIGDTQQPIYVQNVDNSTPLLSGLYDPDNDPDDPLVGCVIRYTGVVNTILSSTYLQFKGLGTTMMGYVYGCDNDLSVVSGDWVTLVGPLMPKDNTSVPQFMSFYMSNYGGITTSFSSTMVKH